MTYDKGNVRQIALKNIIQLNRITFKLIKFYMLNLINLLLNITKIKFFKMR